MSTTTWWDGTSTGYEAASIGPLLQREVNGWYDVRYWGALLDLRQPTTATTVGSPVVTGAFLAADGDAGKLICVRGAGSVALTNTDGAMTTAVSYNANILTGSGFTKALLGRRVTVTGALGGGTLTGFVWGVISSTQIRLTVNCTTIVSGATYTITDNLYTSVIASTASTATLAANASITIGSTVSAVATDDAVAINAAIQAALADTPRNLWGSPPTISIPYACGIGAPIELSTSVAGRVGRVRIVGGGTQGFSDLLARGSVVIRPLVDDLTACIRYAPFGSGLGLRGSISSGTAILTDPDASWVSGDLNKRIFINGAGVQAGSQTQVPLNTTISSVDSATQVTLAANASTSVVEGVYSWTVASGGATVGGNDAFVIHGVHLMGWAGQRCGIHSIGANSYKLIDVTCSDFRSGIGHFADGAVTGSSEMEIRGCRFNDSMIGVKGTNGTLLISGATVIDGNSNVVGVMPGPGTVGIDCSSLYAQDLIQIQAYETMLYADVRANASALRLEGFQRGVVLAGDGSTIGNGSSVRVTSWSTSNVAGSVGRGLVLLPGVTKLRFTPGFYVPSNIGMYTDSDATALATCDIADANKPSTAGAVSTTTPGAVTTVNIAHGLLVTPTRYSAQPANANARGAPAFYVTADATNVILNFASALTAATSYAWAWSAGWGPV